MRATHADNNLVAANLNVEIGAVWPERDDRHCQAPTMTSLHSTRRGSLSSSSKVSIMLSSAK